MGWLACLCRWGLTALCRLCGLDGLLEVVRRLPGLALCSGAGDACVEGFSPWPRVVRVGVVEELVVVVDDDEDEDEVELDEDDVGLLDFEEVDVDVVELEELLDVVVEEDVVEVEEEEEEEVVGEVVGVVDETEPDVQLTGSLAASVCGRPVAAAI